MLQEFIEILILSVVQGISEFLPISSSAHLILVSNLYDLKTSSLLIDISLHLGSLFAIIFYFRKDLFNLKENKKLLQLIVVGSMPLIIFGYILYATEVIQIFRNIKDWFNVPGAFKGDIFMILMFAIAALIPFIIKFLFF